MSTLTLANPWTMQPQTTVRINRSNPITDKLIAAVPGGPLPVEVLTDRSPVFSGSPYPIPSTRGSSWHFAGGQAMRWALGATYSYPFTLSGWYAIDAASAVFLNTAQSDCFAMLRSSSANFEAFSIGITNYAGSVSGVSALVLDNTTGSPIRVNGGTNLWASAWQWKHIVAKFIDLTHVSVYLDGKLDITETTGSRDPQVSNLVMGQSTFSTDFAYAAYGNVQNVAAWNRLLSDAEVISLYRDPWQLYAPLTRVFHMDAPQAASCAR